MNLLKKTPLLVLCLLFASASGATTNDLIKQVKEWGTDLEQRLETAEKDNSKLQKQSDKLSLQLNEVKADHDRLKDQLTQSRRAEKDAEKESDSATRRAEKAEQELARLQDRAERDAAKLATRELPAAMVKPAVAPLMAEPIVEGTGSEEVDSATVATIMKDQKLEAIATVNSASTAAAIPVKPVTVESLPIVVDGVLIPATSSPAVNDIPQPQAERMIEESEKTLDEESEDTLDDYLDIIDKNDNE